jgi:DNA-binding LacI/PurR family transcriptional regulator
VRLIERLEAARVSVPRDVSLVGFDGIAIGALARIALTTVAQPADDLAREAVALLLNRIDRGHDAPPEQHRLPPTLVVRGSTAPPPQRLRTSTAVAALGPESTGSRA